MLDFTYSNITKIVFDGERRNTQVKRRQHGVRRFCYTMAAGTLYVRVSRTG